MRRMLLITGASGVVGHRVAHLLAARGTRVRLMARDPGKVQAPPGCEVVAGDYADPGSLAAPFRGIDTALIVSGYAREGDRARLHGHAISAAAHAGVRHLVYLSFQGASPSSRFPMARDHALTEGLLAASGVPYTALRDSLYLDVIPHLFDRDGVVRGPAGAGRAAFVSREDVAQTVVAVLLQPPAVSGALDVTGPEALSLYDVAARVSGLVGRPLRYEDETVEAGRLWRATSGAPDWEVETWLGSYLAQAAGELEPVSETVTRLTGRVPLTLERHFTEFPEQLAPLRVGPR